VPHGHEFVRQIGNDPLAAAVKFGGNRFHQRRDLGNLHFGSGSQCRTPRPQWVIAGLAKGLHPRAAASQLTPDGCELEWEAGKTSEVDLGISSQGSTFAGGWISPVTMSRSGHEGCLPEDSPRYPLRFQACLR
jgi:hypothetical protein